MSKEAITMTVRKTISEGYRAHVTELQQHWEKALEAEGFDAVLIHAGITHRYDFKLIRPPGFGV